MKDKKRLIICSGIAAILVTAAITYAIGYNIAMNRFNKVLGEVNERQAMYGKLSEVDQIVRQDYLGQIDEEKLKDGICSGYLSGVGEHYARYMNASEYKEYLDAGSNKYTDIGISAIKTNSSDMEVISVTAESPAAKSEIQKGDVIISIGSKNVKDIGYDKSVLRLSRPVGSKTEIELVRTIPEEPNKETKKITVTHEKYQKNPVSFSMIEHNNIGKIVISEFTKDTASGFDLAVSELTAHSAEKFILDLRNSKGDEISSAAQILDRIIPKGTMINAVNKSGVRETLYTSNSTEFQYPITVLINSGTSEAGELVASAIKDYQKGEVIGENSAGKGSMKKVYPISDGSAIIIAVANYTTKSGFIFNNVGLEPTRLAGLSVEKRALLDRRNLADNDDDQIQTALDVLGGITWEKALALQEAAKAEQSAEEKALAEAQSAIS